MFYQIFKICLKFINILLFYTFHTQRFVFIIIFTYARSMNFLFTHLISFNNVFFNLRTNKHNNIIIANCDLDNVCTKYFIMLYVNVEKNLHQFRENYFCKYLHTCRHNKAYNINSVIVITRKFNCNEPIYIVVKTVDSTTTELITKNIYR